MDFKERNKTSLNSTLVIFIVLGFLVIFNFLSTKLFFRIDMTENKQFTISKVTIDFLKKIDDIITIKVYFSENLPPHVSTVKKGIEDTLNDFKAYCKYLKIEFIDPMKDEKIKQKVIRLGVPEIKVNTIAKDQVSAISAFMGMAIFYEDNVQAIPVISNLANLEYELVTCLRKVTTEKKDMKKIGFLSGHNEKTLAKELNHLDKKLRDIYDVQTVQVRDKKIDESIDTLIIAGPEKFSDEDKFALDQFIMKGKKVILLAEPVKIGENIQAKKSDFNLNDLLSKYGIKVETNLVYDLARGAAAMATFNMGMYRIMRPYAYLMKLKNFNSKNPIFNKINEIVVSWASSLTFLNKKDITPIKLGHTSINAGERRGYFPLNPNVKLPDNNLKQFTIIGGVKGKFESYFKGKDIPGKKEKEKNKDTKDKIKDEKKDIIEKAKKESTIIVIGDVDFIVKPSGVNLPFFINLVDWLTLDENLINIRSKNISIKTIDSKDLSETKINAIKIIGTYGVAIIIIFIGLIRYYLRKQEELFVEELTGV